MFLILSVAAILLVMFVFMGIFLSRFTRVGPNQALILSGRKYPRPDGSFARFRIVKGGGAFVWPVFEKADVLLLEVRTIDMSRSRIRAEKGELVELDCAAQFKIKSDDVSIAAAAEYFLNKSDEEIKGTIKPMLEKHLALVLGGLSCEELNQRPEACAAKVQSVAAGELNQMGLDVISVSLRNVRAA